MPSFIFVAWLWALLLHSFVTCSPLTPPILPLIVRNPYLSTWLQNARDVPWSRWPMFWTGEELGFSVLAAASDTLNVYPLLGRPHDSLGSDRSYNVSYPSYRGATFDASTTNLTYRIPGHRNSSSGVDIVLSFLSPITPTSTLRQSIPASYLTVDLQGDLDIDIYLDVNGQWVSGDRRSRLNWHLDEQSLENGKGLKTLTFRRETEQILTEINDRSEWGSLFFTAPSDVRHQVGTSSSLRRRFAKTGTLLNRVDDKYREIMDEEPAFAFAKSFSLRTKGKDSITFTVAHIQDPVVQFAAARGLTLMKPFWQSFFASAKELLKFHYLDFHNATELANSYSTKLSKDALASGAEDYEQIVALSARQVLGATSFSGTPENPIVFLKEISSNGNFQTIDVIFPAFPFFLYTNPRWLAYLLEPLIEHMLSGQYPNTYAMHDLGTHFPNATGHADGNDEYMPVEECGNILIMGLALVNSLSGLSDSSSASLALRATDWVDANRTHSAFALTDLGVVDSVDFIDDSWGGSAKGSKQARKWVERSYPLWKQWTGYLVEFSLRPENQLSTDDFAGWLALQTNLALKGIIGIKAMSGIARIADFTDDAERYDRIAEEYIAKWEEYGISRDGTHAKLAYDWYGSWTTIYNLYADALLCFHLEEKPPSIAHDFANGVQQSLGDVAKETASGFVPQHIYKMQSDWYYAVRQKYGLPLDNRQLLTKSDWQFFAAAVTSEKTRSAILESVAKWVNETVTDRPFTDLYNTEGDGGFPGPNFFARPVIGGHFAFLTLERACGGKAMKGLRFLEEDSSAKRLQLVHEAVRQGFAADPNLDSE